METRKHCFEVRCTLHRASKLPLPRPADKALSHSVSGCIHFFAPVILSWVYLTPPPGRALRPLLHCRRIPSTTHDKLWAAGCMRLLLINRSVLWNSSPKWSSGTHQVSSLTVVSPSSAQISQAAGEGPTSSHSACVLANSDLGALDTKVTLFLLCVSSGLSNLLRVSKLLNVRGQTVPGSVCI